jgi:general secretion pathway protein K
MICLLTLATIVWGFSISMKTEITLARNADYDDEMIWMGRSGIELARFALANKCPDQRGMDALNQFWAGGTSPCSNDVPQIQLQNMPLGRGSISVKIMDMERKWDINMVANPQAQQRIILQQALSVVGVTDAGLASTIEDSILDWCNPNTTANFSGAKDDYYMHLNPPYYCKNGPIDDLSELLLIKGITPEIYWGSNATNHPVSAYQQHGGGAFDQPTGRGVASFHSNKDEPYYPVGLVDLFSPMGGKLNINTAGPLPLQLIPGLDESLVQQKLQERAGPDGVDGTDDDAPFQNTGEFLSGAQGGGPGNGFGGRQGNPGAPGGPNGPGGPGGQQQGAANFIDVRSYVYKVQVDAEINGYKRTFYGIIGRAAANTQQFACVKFYWE